MTTEEATRLPIHGRVVNVRTGEFLSGFRVGVKLDNEQRNELISDSDGRFEYQPAEDATRGWVWVHGTLGWDWHKPQSNYSLTLPPGQFSGEEEVLLEMAEQRCAPIRGIAVAASSGQPLPHFSFTIQSAGWPVTETSVISVVTDDRGEFQTLEGVHSRKITIQAPHYGPSPVQNEPAYAVGLDNPEPLRIEFHAGPRLNLLIKGETPVDPTSLLLRVLGSDGSGPYLTASVHRDAQGTLFVQPGNLRGSVDRRVVLALTDEKGLLWGTCEHLWGDESLQRPLEFELGATSALEVELPSVQWDPEGPIPKSGDRAEATLVAVGALALDGNVEGRGWRLRSMRWLQPGSYELRATMRGFRTHVEPVQLEAGMVQLVHPTLYPDDNLRVAHGVVRSETGAEFDRAFVTLTMKNEGRMSWHASYQRNRMCGTGVDHFISVGKGEVEGTFRFEGIPAGAFELDARWCPVPVDLRWRERDDGDIEIELVLLDDAEGAGFGFLATLEGSEADRTMFTLGTRGPGRELVSTHRCRSGQLLSREDPRERAFEWAVKYAGWRPAFGNQDAFVSEGRERFFASVTLQKGWGTRLFVTDERGTPLSGARVLLDGEHAGDTDSRGTVDLDGARDPGRLTVEFPGRRSFHVQCENPYQWQPWYEAVLPLE